MLQEILCQMLCRRWEKEKKKKRMRKKKEEAHISKQGSGTQWRGTWIFIQKKKCNLFLITQPHINPMQSWSRLSLIAPFPSTQNCGVSEREAAWVSARERWERIHHYDLLLPAPNTLLTDEAESRSSARQIREQLVTHPLCSAYVPIKY